MPRTSQIINVQIEDEVQKSYLNYAMSVIVSRALPDVRDGLKPVHRRILYSMLELGLHHNTAFKKAGRTLGHVISYYHPHGQDSIYFALVRMAQDFSLRYPVVWGQGNFGSIDGDPPAAFRYTECKLKKITEEMLQDIGKNTVDFVLNYDDSHKEPTVLPATLPYLLVNGATGIAVGMTTEVPPHNIREIVGAIRAQIQNPNISLDELMSHVNGPDFPTGAIIKGTQGIRKAYETGVGTITIQSRYTIEESTQGHERIIFTEIPYMKKKSDMIVRLADLVNNKTIESIRDIRDESNREGIRVVIELKKEANVNITLNKILSHSDFQCNYNIKLTALEKNRPKTFSLKEIITAYIEHRKEIITRRCTYELKQAEERAHILKGLIIAQENIDKVITIIKQSPNPSVAKQNLIQTFPLDEIQAQAILEMRLQRLTGIEIKKIQEELKALEDTITRLNAILNDISLVLEIVDQDLARIDSAYGDERKTEISFEEASRLTDEEMMDKEAMVVVMTKAGYIKRCALHEFGLQSRGGKGKLGTTLSKDDMLEHLSIGNTLSTTLFITSQERAFAIKNYQIPLAKRTSKGASVKSILPLENNEKICAILNFEDIHDPDSYLLLTTLRGKTKQVHLPKLKGAFYKRGIRTITLQDDDTVQSALIMDKSQDDIMMFSKHGKVVRINKSQIRIMGRSAAGVSGMRLKENDIVVGLLSCKNDDIVFLITEQGYGKRIRASEINVRGRGSVGVGVININEKTGALLGAFRISERQSVMATTAQGKTIRFNCDDCPIQSRFSRGVVLFKVDGDDIVTSVAIEALEEK